jgi:hypothetical protein
MKKILVLLALAGIIFPGCTDVKLNNVSQSDKGSYSLIPVPGKTGLNSETAFSTTSVIDGAVGGTMAMDQTYTGDNGQQVVLSVYLAIPPGAFTGVKTITLTADDQFAALKCEPAMVFNQSLRLDFSYTGLTLNSSNVHNGRTGFYFVPDSGVLEEVENTGVVVNLSQGVVKVNNAKINHFSRYGWATVFGN